MNAPRSTPPFDRSNRTYYVSDERLRAFGQLTPLQRLQWVEQCSHFVRLAQAAKTGALLGVVNLAIDKGSNCKSEWPWQGSTYETSKRCP